jgi:hypothetical protein
VLVREQLRHAERHARNPEIDLDWFLADTCDFAIARVNELQNLYDACLAVHDPIMLHPERSVLGAFHEQIVGPVSRQHLDNQHRDASEANQIRGDDIAAYAFFGASRETVSAEDDS